MRSSDCPFTVHFYGAMFREGDVMICMEVMDTRYIFLARSRPWNKTTTFIVLQIKPINVITNNVIKRFMGSI